MLGGSTDIRTEAPREVAEFNIGAAASAAMLTCGEGCITVYGIEGNWTGAAGTGLA
jgi:hypothetical protein